LINSKTNLDFGNILDLIPVQRGHSGRLIKLKIVGSKKTMIIGKELEIRKVLSTSHLYSSAFFVKKENIIDNVPQKFILKGAGWGHGVGLCQIGAAVMGEKGYYFDEILLHYFRGADIKKVYD
jgi:SpoIID/LytB domain protein